MSGNSTGLPKSWVLARLGDVTRPIRPRHLPSDYPTLQFIGMEHIEAQSMRLLGSVSAVSMRSSAVHFQPGDVLYGRLRPYLNKVFRPDFEGLCSAEFIVFPETDSLNSKYLQYLLNSAKFVSFASHLNAGDRPRVDFDQISEFPFPLAPVAEQKRIVEEIEKQFTRLEAAVAALKRVQANLKRYRATVLKAGCEGRLVPNAAEYAKRKGRFYEPASILLKRILAEQTQLNKTSSDQPSEVSAGELPHLPEGWVWTTLGLLLNRIEAGKSFKCEERPPVEGELGVVKVSSVTWGKFDELESKTCLDESRFNESYLIRRGDFLFSRANTIELVGACVIVKNVDRKLMLSDKILRFRFPSIPNEWILYWLRSQFGRNEIERLATGNQESMRNIGQERIKSIRIALPPAEEIVRIIAEVERRLSVVGELETQVEVNRTRAYRLRQSILDQAFKGNLVLQNPNDQPAGILMSRIASESPGGFNILARSTKKKGEALSMPRNNNKERVSIIEALRYTKSGMSPEALLSATGHETDSIDEFYAELKTQVEAGLVEENRAGDKIVIRASQK